MAKMLTDSVDLNTSLLTSTAAAPGKSSQDFITSMCIFDFESRQSLPSLYALKFYVNPIVSVLGLSANMMSVAILRRSGLHKPSNILLLGLVISDSMTQLSGINYAENFLFAGPNYFAPKLCGWQYGDGVNYFLLVCDIVNIFFNTLGQLTATTISMVITLERFLAVFMPLTFKRIVTVKTVTASVIACYLIWLPWSIYYLSLFKHSSVLPRTMVFLISFRREDKSDIFVILSYYVVATLSTWVPIAFIGLGCILIGVKIKVTLMKRKRMTSKMDNANWSAKTTRTLLITCFFLFVSLIISSFTNYFSDTLPQGFLFLVLQCLQLLALLNAASNFFVYIATNKKFAQIFLDIVLRRS